MSQLKDLVALIRANTPLIVVETTEEQQVIELFRHALMQVWRSMFRWSITEGLRRIDFDVESQALSALDPAIALREVSSHQDRGIYLFLDIQSHLQQPATARRLRDLVERRNSKEHVLVLVGASIELPAELEAKAVRFRLRLPDENTLLKMVQEESDLFQKENSGRRVEIDQAALSAVVRNLRGLSLGDARRIATQLIYADNAISHEDIPRLAKLKFELINKSGHLHFEFDTAQFADVAGLNRLKRWVELRKPAFNGDSKLPPGLDSPKGVLLLGVQGCGKSLAAKAIAGGLNVPLVRLDFGALYNMYHGETEKNLREALESSEQIAPCVMWIDEIEKGLAAGGAGGDGGLSKRVLGSFLTWMAERKSKVFLVATANAVDELPPELLRKGRFDEVFFVDLPDLITRAEILNLHMRRREINTQLFDLPRLAQACDGFSGAEIEQAVVSALYAAYGANETVSERVLLDEIRATRPLSVLMAEKVSALRQWAASRTVPAD